MVEFINPNLKIIQKDNKNSAIIEIEPLNVGYGVTIGNAIRRVLLSSIPGTAVEKIKLEDDNGPILHEFSTMKGVKEDVCEIVLNTKEIVARLSNENSCDAIIDVVGPCEVTDSEIISDNLTILNPDHHIATVETGHRFHMELTFTKGNGYVSSNSNKEKYPNENIGVIFVDSIFTSVMHANFKTENKRVGKDVNYEKLIIDLTTNGVQTPSQAVAYAAGILNCHFNVFSQLEDSCFNNVVMSNSKEDEHLKKLAITVEDLDLSVRSYNCLKRANVHNVEDLMKKTKEEMMKIRNLGTKSLIEIEKKIEELGFSFKEEI